MEVNRLRKYVFALSLVITFISIFLYIKKNHYWYYPGVVGIWLFFDYLSHLRKNKTTFDLLINKNYKKFFLLYFYLMIFSVIIEIIGNLLLDFWSYTFLSNIMVIISVPINYPFILMSFVETYRLLNSFIKSKEITLIFSMFLGIIIWEIPNLYSRDWIYNIPYVNTEIYHINIIIILGWGILILPPVWIYNKLKI